ALLALAGPQAEPWQPRGFLGAADRVSGKIGGGTGVSRSPLTAAARTVLGKSRAGRRPCPLLSAKISRTRGRLDSPKVNGRNRFLPKNAVSGPARKKNSGHGSNDVIPAVPPSGASLGERPGPNVINRSRLGCGVSTWGTAIV